jgi:hypothetical protein
VAREEPSPSIGWLVLTIMLSIWATVVSTGLALIKVWEISRERVRLTTSYSLTADPEQGNDIIISNVSMTPVMVSYWELLWLRRRNFRKIITDGRFPDEGYCNIIIGPHARYILNFRDRQHFEWGRSVVDKGTLYLKLHVVGRHRPVSLRVYDPQKQ